jgi:serine phosphatase RsbU (regulator of sigma subunit)
MEIQLAVAKIAKYAMSESGDTVEVIERPHGGVSVVLVDGQRSGRSAKNISNVVARKAIALLAEGVRDGAAARAAHDYLRTHRGGKVSAEMIILSADMETGTLVVSRNTQTPVLVFEHNAWRLLDDPASAIGIRPRTRPQIMELPLRPGLVAIGFSDGVWTAGENKGGKIDIPELVQSFPTTLGARAYADDLLAHALQAEKGRPGDDLSVIVLRVSPIAHDDVRRMIMTLPVPPRLYNTWSQS